MSERKFFTVRTDALGKPMYFCGMAPTSFGYVIGIAAPIFNALEFETREDAQQAIVDCDLGDKWAVSECVGGSS